MWFERNRAKNQEDTAKKSTVCNNYAIEISKEDRYSSLQYDLQLSGLTVNLVPIEIGCLGHFLPETIAQMATACEVPKKTIRSLFEQAARIAVSCSYRIFNSRASPDWDLLDHLR